MKNLKEITTEIMLIGAVKRLEELNNETDQLKKLIEKLQPSPLKMADFASLPKTKRRNPYTKDKPHWTQLPENRDRLKKQLARMRKARDAKSRKR